MVTLSLQEAWYCLWAVSRCRVSDEHEFHGIEVLLNRGQENCPQNLQIFRRIDLQGRYKEVEGQDFSTSNNSSKHLNRCWVFVLHQGGIYEETLGMTLEFLQLLSSSTRNFFSSTKMWMASPWCFGWLSSKGRLSLRRALDFAARMLRRDSVWK